MTRIAPVAVRIEVRESERVEGREKGERDRGALREDFERVSAGER